MKKIFGLCLILIPVFFWKQILFELLMLIQDVPDMVLGSVIILVGFFIVCFVSYKIVLALRAYYRKSHGVIISTDVESSTNSN